MYWFILGLLAGLAINFLSRKLMESDSVSLIFDALKSTKLPFSKSRPSSAPAAGPSGERVKAAGVR